ncbi:MAG TPA: glycosyltransferase family A protein [Acidimicrobiales bacterium]|nr:glycosyltransferase family A protein [Acidimicrobiales bacterium]
MTASPDVSVVVPARDAAATIGEQLDALAVQTFEGRWEVIVVDDGSADDTAEVAARWVDRLPFLTVVHLAESYGVAHARNAGTRVARGRLVAYCDADDMVSARWLAGLVSELNENALATGPFDVCKLNAHRFCGWHDDLWWKQPPRSMGYLPEVGGGNMAVRRETFDLVGGFDEALETGEDFDFAWRVQLAGGTIGFAVDSVVHWRLRRGWAYLRRSLDYGLAHVELYRRFRHWGMRRRPLQVVFRLVATGLGAPLVFVPKYRYRWMHLAGLELGRLRGSLVAKPSPLSERTSKPGGATTSGQGGAK